MQVIDIASVLRDSALTHDGEAPRYFSMKYMKLDGSFRTVTQGYRFSKGPQGRPAYKTSISSRPLLKEQNKILIYEVGSHRQEIHPAMIVEYNGMRVQHSNYARR